MNFSKPFSDHSRNPKILEHIFENLNFEEKQYQLTLSLLVKIAFFQSWVFPFTFHFWFYSGHFVCLREDLLPEKNSFFWTLPNGGGFPN